MADVTPRRPISWTAFVAGAVVMLALTLAWSVWRRHDEAAEALRDTAGVVDSVPEVPSLPSAPRLPDVPIPRPK